MQKEFSIAELFGVLKKAWWKMLLVALPVMLVTVALTQLFVTPTYSSKCHFMIKHVTSYTNMSLLQASDHLTNDYSSYIKSDDAMESISQELKKSYGITYSPNQLRSMISTTKSSESSEFSVSVTSTDAQHAELIARLIYEKAPTIIAAKANSHATYDDAMGFTVTGVDKHGEQTTVFVENLNGIEPIRAPQKASQVSPNVAQKAVIAGLVAAVLTYLVCFLRKLFDTIVHTEDDVKSCVDLPILAVIPGWHTVDESKYGKGGE